MQYPRFLQKLEQKNFIIVYLYSTHTVGGLTVLSLVVGSTGEVDGVDLWATVVGLQAT